MEILKENINKLNVKELEDLSKHGKTDEIKIL